MQDPIDKAGRSYWDQVWQGQHLPGAVNPRSKTRHNHAERGFHDIFGQAFSGEDRRGQELLEIGAARSAWLPYFAKEFGFRVSGIDYSDIGCEQARAILRNENVNGRVVYSDFTAPPEDMISAFDVVISFGVIEHFEDTATCVERLARFLKPGGLMISVIPNLTGNVGWIQKRMCRSIYDVHVLLDRRALRVAHQRAGLNVLSSRYFQNGFSSLNLSCRSESWLYPVISRLPTALSMPFWMLDRIKASVRANRLTSPYIICLAQK